jgi:N-acetylmuramoyl-L-alanine amidase
MSDKSQTPPGLPPEAATPIGHGRYVAAQGECISSIAYDEGFFWETLWYHEENAEIRLRRKDPNLLLPGDRVHVPELQTKTQACATETRHRFVKKGVPAKFRLVLLDAAGKPRASVAYELVVDGVSRSGKTTKAGAVELAISPNASTAELIIRQDDLEEEYTLDLGNLDPLDTLTGVLARLQNLGYDCDPEGTPPEAVVAAVRAFRMHHDLEPGDAIDEAFRDRLRSEHDEK